MSASTKRKNRQAAIEAGTYKKHTAQQEREAKNARERRNVFFACAAVAVLVIAAILLNLIPDLREKKELKRYTEGTAVTVGERSYSPAEVGYLYANQYNNAVNNYYAMFYGLNTDNGPQGLAGQAYTGPEMEGKSFDTWRDYFLDAVYERLSQTQTMLAYAREQGIELTEEEQQEIESNMASYQLYAAQYGYSNVDQFLSLNFGKGVTLDTIRRLDTESTLAAKAYDAYVDSLSFSEAELEEEYASFGGEMDTYSYASYLVRPEKEEGQEEAGEVAKMETKAEADAIIAAYQDFEGEAEPYDRLNAYIEEELGGQATLSENISGQYLSSIYADWLMGERKAGDIVQIPDGDNYYIVLFLDHEDARYPTANVRHILIQAQADENGDWSDAALEEAKAEAERILAEWEAGEKTEESFAALAEQYSEDGGSNTNGGLYENIYKGQMVQEFNDFCFGGHQPGDTAIVYGTNGGYAGYHVMYYAGEGENYSDLLAKDALTNEAVEDWLDNSGFSAVPGAEEALVDPVQ